MNKNITVNEIDWLREALKRAQAMLAEELAARESEQEATTRLAESQHRYVLLSRDLVDLIHEHGSAELIAMADEAVRGDS